MSATTHIERIVRAAKEATQEGSHSINQHNALKYIAVQAEEALRLLVKAEAR